MKSHPFAVIDDIDIGRPDDLVLVGQFGFFGKVQLNWDEMGIQQLADGCIRVRHGTQFGAAASSILKKVNEHGFFLGLALFEACIITAHPLDAAGCFHGLTPFSDAQSVYLVFSIRGWLYSLIYWHPDRCSSWIDCVQKAVFRIITMGRFQ